MSKGGLPDKVLVDAYALGLLLHALVGASYKVRELQATRGLPPLPGHDPNPIDTLVEQYNAAINAHAELHS